jgi:hypothetical protein
METSGESFLQALILPSRPLAAAAALELRDLADAKNGAAAADENQR